MLLEAAMAELPRGEAMMGTHSSTTTMTLLQDDHEFGSRILKKDASNRTRFSYKSSVTMQVGGVPFQWEIEPGKPKILTTKDEEEQANLPPIRVSSSSDSPSSSRAQSPSSSTSKVMKSLVMNVKRPESSTNHSPESSFHRSPSTISSPREKKSPLSSLYEPLQSSSSPHCSPTSNSRESNFNSEDCTPSRLNNLAYRSPMLYSPHTPSPYYFSPLSNTSSQSFDATSPRNSIAQGTNSYAPTDSNSTSHGLEMPNTHSNGSNGSIYSTPNLHSRHGALPNSPLSISSSSIKEVLVKDNGVHNGNDSLSFATPEMEILDEGVMANYNNASTMAEFINRGGPMMHRSFSTSRVTFADDYHQKPSQKKYYSAQLNGLAQPKTRISPLQDPTCSALDKLFPLKRPNQFKAGTDAVSNGHTKESAQDEMDAMGCTKVGGMGNVSNPLERAAEEVVIQASDEEGYAYTPVASAFVFSPRRASQNNYFMRSSSARVLREGDISYGGGASANNKGEAEIEKSILKKTSYSHELPHDVHTEGQRDHHPSVSPKISSVLLRFAEAQERLYDSAASSPRCHYHHCSAMPTTACLPMCSFLGRAFLCRSKLGSGHLHEK